MISVVVSANAVVSGPFLLERRGSFSIRTDSMASASVGVAFAPFASVTDAASGDFATLFRDDGSGLPWTATSGSAPAWSAPIRPVSPVARLVLGASVNAPRSFAIFAAL